MCPEIAPKKIPGYTWRILRTTYISTRAYCHTGDETFELKESEAFLRELSFSLDSEMAGSFVASVTVAGAEDASQMGFDTNNDFSSDDNEMSNVKGCHGEGEAEAEAEAEEEVEETQAEEEAAAEGEADANEVVEETQAEEEAAAEGEADANEVIEETQAEEEAAAEGEADADEVVEETQAEEEAAAEGEAEADEVVEETHAKKAEAEAEAGEGGDNDEAVSKGRNTPVLRVPMEDDQNYSVSSVSETAFLAKHPEVLNPPLAKQQKRKRTLAASGKAQGKHKKRARQHSLLLLSASSVSWQEVKKGNKHTNCKKRPRHAWTMSSEEEEATFPHTRSLLVCLQRSLCFPGRKFQKQGTLPRTTLLRKEATRYQCLCLCHCLCHCLRHCLCLLQIMIMQSVRLPSPRLLVQRPRLLQVSCLHLQILMIKTVRLPSVVISRRGLTR